MARLNIGFEYGAGGAQRRKRQSEAQSLVMDLLGQGLQPDEINAVVKSYVKSGDLTIPSYRTTTQMLDPVEDIPQRSTRVTTPIKYGKPETPKKRKVMIFDKGTGRWTDRDVEGYDDVDFHTFDSTPEHPKDDPGEQARRSAALRTLAQYQAALAKTDKAGTPLGVTKELAQNARRAAEYLGIGMDENVEVLKTKPWWSSVQDAISDVAPVVPKSKARTEIIESSPTLRFGPGNDAEYEKDMADAKKAVSSGKVSQEEAQRRLKLKYPSRFKK